MIEVTKLSLQRKTENNQIMSTETKNEFILFFRGAQWDKGLSPEQIQKAMDQFMGWFDRLREEGKLKAGQPLERTGKIVSGKKGKIVADGPFAESKEAVGGYFLLHVANLDEAVEIARQCPILEYGSTVEVRPVAERCPTMEQHGLTTEYEPVPIAAR